MDKKLENKLYKKYPSIFQERKLPPSKTAMCWGMGFGDGWYHIIDSLCSTLKYIEKAEDIKIIATQVKQKFGSLRFYYRIEGLTNDKVWGYIGYVILIAEKLSAVTCEQCGAVGKLREKIYVETMCDICYEKTKQ